jgi:orotate phosphoribosyltransferase
MDSETLLRRLKAVAYLEGEFITRSGSKTNYYIDKYLFSTQPDILAALGKTLAALMPEPDSYDRIGAPELGAVAIAAAVAIEVQKPFLIVRKQSKEYGTKRMIEGAHHKGERLVMIEDILTTGGAVLQACQTAEDEGLHVSHILGVINREEGADENIKKRGYALTSLFTRSQLHSVK